MYRQDITNNVCTYGDISDDNQRRVRPFLHQSYNYDKNSKKWTPVDSKCTIPDHTKQHFKMYDGCILQPKFKDNVTNYRFDNDNYPAGCSLSINDSFADVSKDMISNLDYDYLNKIKLLEQELSTLTDEVNQINARNDVKYNTLSMLTDECNNLDKEIQSSKSQLQELEQGSDIRQYNEAKAKYESNAITYNTKLRNLQGYIDKCNDSLGFALLYQHCDFGGTVKALRLQQGEKAREFPDLYEMNRQVSSIRLPPGIKLTIKDSRDRSWMWARQLIIGLDNWGYEGNCLVDIGRNDRGDSAVLERTGSFQNKFSYVKPSLTQAEERRMIQK